MDAELRTRFGTLVAAHRNKRGLTQQQLADITTPPLSVNMIGRIETGKTGASSATIVNLARALDVDEAEFCSIVMAYVKEVEAGQNLLLTSHGKPVAELRPASTPEGVRRPGALRGRINLADDFDTLPEADLAAMESGD